MKRQMTRSVICLVLAGIFCLCCLPAAGAEDVYVENEWNFVDQSMDISQGIPANATGVLDRIKRRGLLRVATEPFFAPQEFIDPEKQGQEQYAGADMELARLIAERMGVGLEIIPMEFTQVLPSLTEDQCDLAISAVLFTPGRASTYTLSKGYYFPDRSASTAFVIREADRDQITSVDDLRDKIIVAQTNSLQEALASSHVYSYKEFRRVSSLQAVYEALKQGKADAGVVDLETAETYVRNNPDAGLIVATGLRFKMEDYFLGDRVIAKKGELQLMYFVNGVIDEVLDGQYETWVGEAQNRADELGL